MGSSAISERVELAKLCSSRDWSKAIRVLDSLLSQSFAIQDICYISHLGRAFSALGRKEDALLVWDKGYEHAVRQSADLKQLLELEELLRIAKQERSISDENNGMESMSSVSASGLGPHSNGTYKNQNKLSDESKLCSASGDSSEFCSGSSNNFDLHNGFSDKALESTNFDGQMIESHDIVDKLSYESDSCSDLSDTSEPCSKLSTICNSPSNTTETSSKLTFKSEIHNEIIDEAKKNKKFCVARISKTKSISVDFRLSRGIAQVNEGKYAHAISIFDQILKEDPTYPEALIGRGTAYAFQRELEAAIADFTKAIESNPSAGEAWKRRGQARAALGESVQAIEDLTKALEFEPNSADILHERGIVSFKFKDFNASVEDLSTCVKLDKDNASAYTYLGLSLSSIGEFIKAEEAHKKSIELDQHFLEAWTHLTQLYQDLANPTKALECLQHVLQIDGRFARAYHLRGLLFHGMGEHRKAIKDLSAGLGIENDNIECLYLRASCYHAIGEYREAVKDYDAALDLELDSMEKFVLQCLAFYQEYWCKRLHPKNVCEKVFRQPPLRESLKKGKLRKQDHATTKQKTALLHAADSIGKKIQYDCPGFLPNKRQHRMAGLAIIEIAQRISKAWRSLQHSNKSTSKSGKRARRRERINIPSQNRGGAGCSTSSSLETSTSFGNTEDTSLGRSTMSWQEVYSFAVKWRQISEPCDPVVWINKLSEEFNSGFGSHTPMILGQAKVVRYYPNYERTLDVAKTVIKDQLYVYSKEDKIIDLSKDGKLEDILGANSCSDLYRVVGEDFWLATWCNSAFEGKRLEGTRITLVKIYSSDTRPYSGYLLSSPTGQFSQFQAICSAYCGEAYGSTDFNVLENVRDAILRMTYYWYNFMPLSRGSAVVGFVVMLGLLLAANMECIGNIPQGVQVDWDAILNFDPNSFVDSVKSWLNPSLKVTTSWKNYPDVASTLATTGSVVSALSSYDD
ncbi:suppressor of rps4-rld 1 [Quercus suber]|uniref:Suppressor of rps4-rld 1 n=1 Tax=Quercus suber TaxID=58331 RepID=A0AAW0K481_QUESU